VPSIDWRPWHTAAFLEAQRRHRPVLLLLDTAWSPACARAHVDVFSRPDVVAAVTDTTVPVRVDADLRPDIGDRYGLGHWPSLLILTPEGHVLTGGTHMHDALAARIRDAARVFAAHEGPWPPPLPVTGPAPTLPADDAAVLDAFAMAIEATRDSRTGACVHDGRPSAGAALFALAHATARGDAEWASTAADTIEALDRAAPSIGDTGVVAFATDAEGAATVARVEDQADWVGVLSRAVRLEPWPDWTTQLDRLVHGLRSTFRRDDGHWRPWPGAAPVLVDASARACRALLAAADALDRSDLAHEAIDSLEVLAPIAYSRGSGVSHVIADGRTRGPVLLDDAMLLAHALLDADAWRADPVYRDLAEELVRTSLSRLQEPSGAIRDRIAALAGAGQVGRLADAHHPLTGNAATARLLRRLFPDDAGHADEARRILAAVTPEAIAAGAFGAPVALAWHALGPAGAVIAAW
jgi:hypothetical protein